MPVDLDVQGTLLPLVDLQRVVRLGPALAFGDNERVVCCDCCDGVVRTVTGNQDYEFGDWTRGLAQRVSQYRFGDITRSVISSLAANSK